MILVLFIELSIPAIEGWHSLERCNWTLSPRYLRNDQDFDLSAQDVWRRQLKSHPAKRLGCFDDQTLVTLTWQSSSCSMCENIDKMISAWEDAILLGTNRGDLLVSACYYMRAEFMIQSIAAFPIHNQRCQLIYLMSKRKKKVPQREGWVTHWTRNPVAIGIRLDGRRAGYHWSSEQMNAFAPSLWRILREPFLFLFMRVITFQSTFWCLELDDSIIPSRCTASQPRPQKWAPNPSLSSRKMTVKTYFCIGSFRMTVGWHQVVRRPGWLCWQGGTACLFFFRLPPKRPNACFLLL